MSGVRGVLRENEPMARHTSWRVGGPADLFFQPADADDLCEFLATLPAETPVCWIGLGSNLLVRDGGIAGVVIHTQRALGELDIDDDSGDVHAGAGVACAQLARRCGRAGLVGAGFFAGIPGTVGGALAMNAGAWGGETWAHVTEVETVDRRGGRHRRSPEAYRVGYRSVQGRADEWFVGARFRFATGGDPEALASEVKGLLARRAATQPTGRPSCGSVFRNPPGDHAARLIEAAGLKGLRRGGAMVSDKHANFIINTGDATAADIEWLIGHVQAEVARRHAVELVPEVRIVGREAAS
jgi:UDP-N-acetylmuramate dehydrogenase